MPQDFQESSSLKAAFKIKNCIEGGNDRKEVNQKREELKHCDFRRLGIEGLEVTSWRGQASVFT